VGIANVGLQFVADFLLGAIQSVKAAVVGLVPTPEERTAQQFAKEQARQQQSADAQRFRYFQRGCPERGITCQALIKTTRVGIANVGLQFVAVKAAVVGLVPTPEERTAQQFAKEQARQQQSAEKREAEPPTEGTEPPLGEVKDGTLAVVARDDEGDDQILTQTRARTRTGSNSPPRSKNSSGS
jgi:hypothetical protein